MKIPKGWRRLSRKDHVKEGDKVWLMYPGKWDYAHASSIGWTQNDSALTYIRRIPKRRAK